MRQAAHNAMQVLEALMRSAPDAAEGLVGRGSPAQIAVAGVRALVEKLILRRLRAGEEIDEILKSVEANLPPSTIDVSEIEQRIKDKGGR